MTGSQINQSVESANYRQNWSANKGPEENHERCTWLPVSRKGDVTVAMSGMRENNYVVEAD
ncbi:16519_t:CDS:2 [Acaulospora morrowiae]|uniref:16519_t:CDS:1 n=1 Tax=Acaulospora morrowiae TaxID=94023 RepID=A0A9N9E2T2_9GLOM|nr:16519_t:CDS:2 [Acaulospora morrowiae]